MERGGGGGREEGEGGKGVCLLMRFIYLIEFDITSPTNLANITNIKKRHVDSMSI